MSKRTNGHAGKAKQTPATDVIVFGLDKNQKALAGRFPAAIADLAIKAAKQQNLSTLRVASPEVAALAARLPVGRVHGSGQKFVPAARRQLYDQIQAVANPKDAGTIAATGS